MLYFKSTNKHLVKIHLMGIKENLSPIVFISIFVLDDCIYTETYHQLIKDYWEQLSEEEYQQAKSYLIFK